MDCKIAFMIGVLVGGVIVGSSFVKVLFDEAGKPTDSYDMIVKALERFRGIIR